MEGAAELFLFEALASRLGYDLTEHAVSVISTEGLNFDAFIPLFGETGLQIPVAILTDSDPPGAYPKAGESLEMSDTAKGIAALANKFVQPFFAQKTLEYDLAMDGSSRNTMLTALADLHKVIAKELTEEVNGAPEEEKAKLLFKGMFERGSGRTNVQKGAFAQSLAQAITADGFPMNVPPYIEQALKFVMAE
ncbi:hypothetical protein PQQ79_21010 [Paraburkholderia caledonica]